MTNRPGYDGDLDAEGSTGVNGTFDEDFDPENERWDDEWYEDMYFPSQWELWLYDMRGLWLHIRHSVLMVVSKNYRDHINDIPF